MSKIASEISRGTEKGQKWAEVMGMSIEEVQHLFEVDAYGALIKMVEGLEKVDASGGNVDATLRELGVTEIRQLDVMKRLIGSSEDLANAQRMASDEYKNNNELLRESEERYKTFESQMQKLKNGISNIWSNIGGAIAKSSGEMIEWINRIVSNVERMTDAFFDAEGGLTQVGENFAKFVKIIVPVVTALGVVGGAFMLFGPAGLYALAVIAGLGAIAGAFGLLHYELSNTSFEKAMNKISSSADEASRESINSFTKLRQGIHDDMNRIQLESGEAAEKTKERIVDSFRQLHDEIRVLNDEEQGKMIAMVEKRMETATGKELEALKQLKNQIVEDYKDLDNTLDAHIRTISNNMKDVVDENGKVNTDVLKLIASSAKQVDEIAGTSISNSMSKLAEYGEALSDVEIKEMSSREVKKTLKSATEEAASALEETTVAYKQNRDEVEASNLSDESKAAALAMLDQEYTNTRQGVMDYVSALIDVAEEQGHNVKSLGKLTDIQKESFGLTEKEIMTNHLRKRSLNSAKLSVDDFKDSYKRASEETKKANKAWDEAVESLSKLGEEFGTLPGAIEASKGESSAAAERLGKAVALSTEGGIKAVDLGESGMVLMEDFVEGLRTGEYSTREVGLGIINKLRSTIGLESFTNDGFKKMEEFVSGLQSGEQSVEQFAQNLGLNLSENTKMDLGPSGEVSMKDFVTGLENGTYGVEELAIGLTNNLQSSLEVDLSGIGEQDIRTLSMGLKSGLLTVDDITNTLGQNLKDGATVELGDKGKYTIGTLVEGLSNGELKISDVMEGIEALMEGKAKIDLSSQARETMDGYVQAISEQTGLPVEEIESMIKQMYETTGSVDFSELGIEIPQEISDGVNTEAPKLYQTAEEMIQQLEESLTETEGATEAGQQIPEDMSSGIESTFDNAIQSAQSLKEGVGETLSDTDDGGGGENAGKSFLDGLLGWVAPPKAKAAEISDGVEEELGTTDDGGGGDKSGSNFTSSLAVYNPIAVAIANSLKTGTESELGATTDGNGGDNAGSSFVSGLGLSLTPAQQIAEASKGNVEGTLGTTSDGGGGSHAMETFASQITTHGIRAYSTARNVVNNVQNSLGSANDGGGGNKAMTKFNIGLSTGGSKAVKSSSNIINRVKNTLSKATDGKGGNRAGNQFYKGIQGNVGKIQSTSRNIVSKVKGTLSRATDGNGGRKVGREFTSGIRSHIGSAGNAATSMAAGAKNRVRANSNTYGLGSNFGSGFVRGIRSYIGAAISAATALARAALNAVKRTQRSASPSKETMKLGSYFGDGFALAISDSTKKAEKASKELAKNAMSALNDSLNTDYGELMSSSINGFDVGENSLQQELVKRNNLDMTTREDINVNVVNQINGRDYEVFVKDVSNEIDKQKKREARF